MRKKQKSLKYNRQYLLPGYLQPYLNIFTKTLAEQGYTLLTIEGYYDSIAHFGAWLQKKSIPLQRINDSVIFNFSKHNCCCPGFRKNNKVSYKYVKRISRFILFLRQQKVISPIKKERKTLLPPLFVKFKESLYFRGLSKVTIVHYMRSILKLLPLLGYKPKKYNSLLVRQVICKVAKRCSLVEVKKYTTALRVYLRFLAVEGACHPDLDNSVPKIAEWRLASLPKYITFNEVERVIASCNTRTKLGLRDRAIILLLARLGLRAGDISNMILDDINWLEGTIRVRGKGRREVALPLPQEVGDAILAYLERSRPQVAFKQIFLCFNAPFRPFPCSSGISSIVSSALLRANISNPPTHGANLLRHSAATNMLRKGATLQTVSEVLRHRSLDMTGYYAKVDIKMLMQIAQPWPDGAPC